MPERDLLRPQVQLIDAANTLIRQQPAICPFSYAGNRSSSDTWHPLFVSLDIRNVARPIDGVTMDEGKVVDGHGAKILDSDRRKCQRQKSVVRIRLKVAVEFAEGFS